MCRRSVLAKLTATLESRKEHRFPHPPSHPPGCCFLISSHPEVSPFFAHVLSLSLSLSLSLFLCLIGHAVGVG